MTQYNAYLNKDKAGKLTSAIYVDGVGWVNLVQNYAVTAGGLLVPLKSAGDGRLLGDANLQIGDADVGNTNPVPAKIVDANGNPVQLVDNGDGTYSIPARILNAVDTKPSDRGAQNVDICSAADTSGGVTAALGNYNQATLYLESAGSIKLTVEVSPNGGTDIYEILESPIILDAGEKVAYPFTYKANWIKITGSNTSAVTAKIRGIY